MSDTCHICGRYYSMYSEGHDPNTPDCLKNQYESLKARILVLEKKYGICH